MSDLLFVSRLWLSRTGNNSSGFEGVVAWVKTTWMHFHIFYAYSLFDCVGNVSRFHKLKNEI